jgi:prepilin-type N-terminal cleavage/methylation domain-containing protein
MPKLGKRGFTLLEAVAALAILGIAGVAALEAVASEVRAADRARTAATVSALAQDRLAALTLLPIGDLQPLADSVARGTFPSPFQSYGWIASVRPVFGAADLYDVSVEISGPNTRFVVASRLYRSRPNEAIP